MMYGFDPIYFATLEKYDTKEKYAKAPPTETFQVGATVMKVAWRIATADDDPNKVFVTTAAIAKLVNGPGGTVVAVLIVLMAVQPPPASAASDTNPAIAAARLRATCP